MTRWDRDPYLMRVIRAFGTAANLAEFLGLTKQGVAAWKQVPVCHVRAISEKTGIHPYKIRPDLYIEGFWNMGKNTADMAKEMGLEESEICYLLAGVLERRRNRVNDYTYPSLPPVSEPSVESK